MKRILLAFAAFTLSAGSLQAANYYYTKPDAATLPDNARILMYDPATGSDKNITGSVLKQQVAPSQQTMMDSLAQPTTSTLRKSAAPGATDYTRQVEVKDASGKIVMFITANGAMTFGTPVALAVSAVSPANGATNVPINTLPTVTFNKSIRADDISISNIFVQGSTAAPYGYDGVTFYIPATLAPNTTYTIKVLRTAFVQEDGETDSSCGPMTDVSGVCQSTFTTAP